MIYLASPYTHKDESVRRERFMEACRATGKMMGEGKIVFSPIAHSHPISLTCDLPGDWKYWEQFDRDILSACSEVVVLMLYGWKESTGIRAELKIAEEMGIPVSYMDPEPHDPPDRIKAAAEELGLGATGKFPEGKAMPADEGELQMAVGSDGSLVHLNFGTPTKWIGLPPDRARGLALLLVKHADAIKE